MSTNTQVAIIGLTGGIATGKSTVSEMFSELGARVIDADLIAREVVEPGTPALAEIAEVFGDAVIDAKGALDREALGEIVFGDEESRQKLNQITHPRIAMRMLEHAQHASDDGYPWVIYDAALIVESGFHGALAGLIVVVCSSETQLRRLLERDDVSESQARERIASQLPLARKVAVADWVIDNEGTLAATRGQVVDLFRTLTDEFGPLE